MELRKSVNALEIFTLIALAAPFSGGPAMAQEPILLLNAQQESKSCLFPTNPEPDSHSNCSDVGPNARLFLRHGKRAELRVYNRKFQTDYSITIDAVTSIQSGPNIRNVNEAESITFGAPTFAGAPPSKGGAEGLASRSTIEILYQLLDEGTATRPIADLKAEEAVIGRESNRIQAETASFRERFQLLRGSAPAPGIPIDCRGVGASPDAWRLKACIEAELQTESSGIWLAAHFGEAEEFSKAVLRVQDLVAAVKNFGGALASSDLVTRAQKIEMDIAQYENDLVIFQGNVQASEDAANLATGMQEGLRKNLHREQLKQFLSQKLKAGQTPPSQDEANINQLIDSYERSSEKARIAVLGPRWKSLLEAARAMAAAGFAVEKFRDGIESIRQQLGVDLPDAVDKVSSAQGKLLARVNEVYDNSEITEPLKKQIDISGHPGNLIVYYTIRRIEMFTRFTVTPVTVTAPVGQTNMAASTTQLPPSKGAASADTQQPSGAAGGAGSGGGTPAAPDQAKPTVPPGVPVSSGSFEVHDVFHANVVAAFAISGLKDQSIAKQATPLGCGGTVAKPDTNCFTPILNGGNRQQQVILGLDYYLQPRDTFPRDNHGGAWKKRWLCAEHTLQCIGPMGAVSVNGGSNFFLGAFFEPVLGVQVASGGNFGSERTLQRNFQFGTPVDITGDFPTYQKRTTGWFMAAGLDLGIFRKIFGKVTGIGTAISGTQGK